jgi:hypothetical protein
MNIPSIFCRHQMKEESSEERVSVVKWPIQDSNYGPPTFYDRTFQSTTKIYVCQKCGKIRKVKY